MPTRPLAARIVPVRLGPEVERLPRVLVQERLQVGDVGERGAEPLGPHRVDREHDLAVVGVAEEHVRERVGDALGEQEQQVARVVVVDVGHRERALAAVHGDDVGVGRRSRAARASDGHGERSSHSPKHIPNRAGWPNTVRDVSPARWPPMLRRQSETARPIVIEPAPAGAAHAAGAVVDAERVARRAVHDQHREHARGRGREPERVPLRRRASASSAASTSGNASGCTPAIAAFAATSSTVATPYCGGSTPTTWSAGSGVHASSASIAASVGGSSGAPSPHCSASDSS